MTIVYNDNMSSFDSGFDTSVIKPPRVEILTRNTEGLLVFGHDNSTRVFPHFGITWNILQDVAFSTGKPVADCGSAYSTVAVEAHLRGIDVVPIDVMWPDYREDFCGVVQEQMYKTEMVREFTGDLHFGIKPEYDLSKTYFVDLEQAIKAVKVKYLHADLAKIPRSDRFFSVCLVHDTVPKHSADVEEFLGEQLPELLRVTDQAVYIYPMGIYRPVYYHLEYDSESDEKVWNKVSFPGEWEWRNNRKYYNVEFKEALPLYGENAKEPIERIQKIAQKRGFEFSLAQAKYWSDFDKKWRFETTQRGVFTRKNS